jgi:hypothetical protein
MLSNLGISLFLLVLAPGLSGGLGDRLDAGLILATGRSKLFVIDFGLLLAGSVLIVIGLANSQQIPALPDAGVDYESALPGLAWSLEAPTCSRRRF